MSVCKFEALRNAALKECRIPPRLPFTFPYGFSKRLAARLHLLFAQAVMIHQDLFDNLGALLRGAGFLQ